MFQDLSQPDSIVILLYLGGAFLLGVLSVLLFRKKKPLVEKDNKKTEDNSVIAITEPSTEELHAEITQLKQAHFFLSKDYEMALQAMHSLREQAEEMQLSISGNNVTPRSASDSDVETARHKLKNYVEQQLSIQSEAMSISDNRDTNKPSVRISPIDSMNEELVIILAKLIID